MSNIMNNSSISKKYLRGLGHHLKPIIHISKNGLSENIESEIEQALIRHELIKIKISSHSRIEKSELCMRICNKNEAMLVQLVGNIMLLFKSASNPNPNLSNLLRNKALF